MSAAVQTMLDVLNIEQLEVNLFRGRSPQDRWQRVFGGQVIGQALVAASRTVEGRQPHSLHAYFLIGGDPKVPIIYEVDRIRDGKSFTTRRVVAIQHGHAIFTLMVSFHNDEEGLAHQVTMPEVPPPEKLAERSRDQEEVSLRRCPRPCSAITRASGRSSCARSNTVAISARRARPATSTSGSARPASCRTIPRSTNACSPTRPTCRCSIPRWCATAARLFEKDFMGASLDHALWFHRPFRADDWLLYAQDSPNLLGSRGLSRGLIFTRDGALVASVAQEGLVRLRRAES